MDGQKLVIPTVPCRICRGRHFWYRKTGSIGDWLCAWCHPPPDNSVVPVVSLGMAPGAARENYRRMVQIMTERG